METKTASHISSGVTTPSANFMTLFNQPSMGKFLKKAMKVIPGSFGFSLFSYPSFGEPQRPPPFMGIFLLQSGFQQDLTFLLYKLLSTIQSNENKGFLFNSMNYL
jgi:hypothetical protein